MNPEYIIYFLSLSAGTFLLFRKSAFSSPYFWLGIYLLVVGLLQITAGLFITYFGSNTMLYLISIPFTFGLIFMLFQNLIRISKIKKQLRAFGGIFLLVITLQIIFHDGQRWNLISELLITYNIAVVSFCLLYYFQMLHIPEEKRPSRQGIFWIVNGFFFYFLLSFVFWMVAAWFPRLIPGFDYFNEVLVIMFYMVLWIGIIVHLKEKKVDGGR